MNKQDMLLYSSSAIFDTTRTYRYSLKRVWSHDYPPMTFIMLNPSKAGELHNDPTISRCIDFAHTWGFGAVEVVNLFAYCTSNPSELSRANDPIGKDNDYFLMQAIAKAHYTVIAWGTRGTFLDRNRRVLDLLDRSENLYCLGHTKEGHPRHPLYLKKNTALEKYIVRNVVCDSKK